MAMIEPAMEARVARGSRTAEANPLSERAVQRGTKHSYAIRRLVLMTVTAARTPANARRLVTAPAAARRARALGSIAGSTRSSGRVGSAIWVLRTAAC